jgi:cobalt/nickel transport system permease protein
MHLPDWLAKKEPEASKLPRGSGSSYIEKTLYGIAKMAEDSIFSEIYSQEKGLLQGIEPRVKLVFMLLAVAGVSFLKNVELILAVYALILLAAWLSKINLFFFIKRNWLFIPAFSGIVALPAIFSFVTPGEQLVSFATFGHAIGIGPFQLSEIAITKEGALGALTFIFRVATSVALVLLLTLTTRWNTIMKSLRAVFVPKTFILVLSMSYQYILILARVVQEMHFAKKSRTICSDGSARGLGKERDWVASRIGAVLMRSYAISEEVHSAMVSRGFRGEVK